MCPKPYIESMARSATEVLLNLTTIDPAIRSKMMCRAFDEIMHEFRLTHLRLSATSPHAFCVPVLAKIQYAEECAKFYIKELEPIALCRVIAATGLLHTARQTGDKETIAGYEHAWEHAIFPAVRDLIRLVSIRARGFQLNG